MNKPMLSTILSCALLSQSVFAASLNEYRRGILKPAQTDENQSRERLKEIQQAIGTAGTVIQGLDGIVIPNDRHHRPYSSITLKDIMQNGVTEVMRSIEMDAPPAFDPSWTPDEQAAVKSLSDRKRCIRSLMNSRKVNGKADGLNLVVDEIYSKLAVPEFSMKEKKTDTKSVDKIAAGFKLRQVLTNHLSTGPLNTKGQSVIDVMGEISDVESADGLVHRVFFGKGENAIPASLSMMLTRRLGEDHIFVQTQDCLLNYLKDQSAVFTERQGQLNSWVSFGVLKKGYESMKNWLGEVERAKPSILQSSGDKNRAQDEINEMYEMIQTEDSTAQFLAKMKFFSEGRDFSKDSAGEKKFVEERLKLSRLVIPFLEENSRVARLTRERLKGLSRPQVNYLLDMFLQLRGGDLPTAKDMTIMGEAFSTASASASSAAAEQMGADFIYYRVIGTQLTDLQQKTACEGSILNAKKHELDLLKNR